MNEFSGDEARRLLKASPASVIFEEAPLPPGAATDLRVKKVELVVRCQELSRFLRGLEETHWAAWLEECVTSIRQNSTRGVEKLLGGYSGMGCISDVYLCPEAGHRLNARDEDAINEQYLLMLSKVNNLARDINPGC